MTSYILSFNNKKVVLSIRSCKEVELIIQERKDWLNWFDRMGTKTQSELGANL